MLRFAALIAVALMLAPSLAAAQGTAPVGIVSDDETSVSRAYENSAITPGSIVAIFTLGNVAETESEAIGLMATLPAIFSSGLASTIEESGSEVGPPEPVTVTPVGDETSALRMSYTVFGSVEGEVFVLAVRQDTWVQLLIGMGIGEASAQGQLEQLAATLQPRWPSSDPITVRPDGLRTGGIWNMVPAPEDLPAGYTVDPEVEEGPGAGAATTAPGTGTTPVPPAGTAPTPSLDLPLLPTPTPPGGQAPPLPDQTPAAETPVPPVGAIDTPAPADVATPAPNPRLALPFDVTVEIFLPLDMATISEEDGSCSGSGLLDGLSAEAEVRIQSATGGTAVSASAPMSGPGQVAFDRESGEEICYFRATVTDVPARARYSVLAGDTVLGQYTYDELTETGAILVVIDGED